MSGQARSQSFLESVCDTIIGFIMSIVVWQLICVTYLSIHMPLHTNIVVTSLFTISSFMRRYFTRRLFNRYQK